MFAGAANTTKTSGQQTIKLAKPLDDDNFGGRDADAARKAHGWEMIIMYTQEEFVPVSGWMGGGVTADDRGRGKADDDDDEVTMDPNLGTENSSPFHSSSSWRSSDSRLDRGITPTTVDIP